MRLLLNYLIPIILFLFQFNVSGQGHVRQIVMLNLENASWEELVESIEQQTSYKFFYRQEWLDSFAITIENKGLTVEEALDLSFQGTNLKYSIDYNGNRIFITENVKILTELPITFTKRTSKPGAAQDSSMLEYLKQDNKYEEYKTSFENRQYAIGDKSKSGIPGKATIAGYVKDSKTGEPIIGATVYIENPWIGVSTDRFGYYSITLPKGRHELKFQSVGMRSTKRQIMLYSDGKLDIDMIDEVISLKEVVVSWKKDDNVSSVKVGFEKIDIKSIKQVPTAMGESDILKVTLTLPGVQTVGESSTGLNVRGGNVDQNLILYNDAVIYNPTHLFGFFSAFNPDVLQEVELYKSGIPANYGGRISSVLEVNTREGNKKEFSGSGGIGLVTGRLTLEGPIIKDKSSFIISGRSSYSDWILKRISNEDIKNSDASFYDVNASVNHQFNEKNSVYLSWYRSADKFQFNNTVDKSLYEYRNNAISAKWKHVFKNEFINVTTAAYSNYNYTVSNDDIPENAFRWKYSMDHVNLKTDFHYLPTSKHEITFGGGTVFYHLKPGEYLPWGAESDVASNVLENERALESNIYVGDQYNITRKLTLYYGIRYSLYNALGPADINAYLNGLSKSDENIEDTISYSSGEIFQTYHGPEYRASLRYALPFNASVKVSYNRMRQYIHMLSNTTSVSPTDIWKLSDTYIKPQIGDQVSLGLYKNFKSGTIETSVETFYKTMKDFLDYKSGAELVLNHHIETDIAPAEGYAYGAEFMVRKLNGRLNGWVSYTYSRSLIRVNDINTAIVNNGEYFSSNYDKPHDFTLVSNYRFTQRLSFSMNLTYSTGRPITHPIAKYSVTSEYPFADNGLQLTDKNSYKLLYSDRNAIRIPDYFRIDCSINIEGNHKIKKLTHGSYSFSVYNLTGRKNPYSVFFRVENGRIKGYKMSIFGRAIPTISYNFKF